MRAALTSQTKNGRLRQQAARSIATKGDNDLLDFNVTESASPGKGDALARRVSAWLDARITEGRKERFCEVKAITPAIAEEMLKRNTRNRPISKARIAKYTRLMEEGRWKLTMEGIGFDTAGVLQNGQHRLRAIIESGAPAQFAVWFGCDPSEFAYLDSGGNRTGAHLIAIEGLDYWITRAAVARQILYFEHSGDKSAIDADRTRSRAVDMADAVMADALREAARSVKVCNHTTGTLAYWTIAKKTRFLAKLPEFWGLFVSGAIPDPSSPLLKMRDLLATGGVETLGSNSRNTKEAAAIILAWNAWVAKRRRSTFPWPHVVKLPDVL